MNKKKKAMEYKLNQFIKEASEQGIFNREYASEEERNREIRKIISKKFNVHAEFIGIEQESIGKSIITKMTIEEPIFLK